MGLEVATMIHQLVVTNPTAADKIRQGDDHIRLIKVALKTSFPGITGVLTKTHTALNLLPNNWTTFLAELANCVMPRGAVIAWHGTIVSIPAGWHLCDGTNVGGYGVVPDLTDKFIMGAGDTFDPGDTGGSPSIVSAAEGGHLHTVGNTVLTEAQLPPHEHFLFANVEDFAGAAISAANQAVRQTHAGGDQEYKIAGIATAATVGKSSTTGASAVHAHGLTAAPDHTHAVTGLNPYYALAYIVRTHAFTPPA